MDAKEVNKKLLDELEEMGFPLARAMNALYKSGNSSLEDAINWIVDHENDPDIDQMPSVPVKINIEDVEASVVSEEVKLTAHKLRKEFGQVKNCKKQRKSQKKTKENGLLLQNLLIY
ncbi:uncharacterized protein LOC143537443 [Bidens hawaiensis]|uniref:uncharacterized protein LOC143537443 n=1 Tax=Bidens hawaiensis TaxID=980011 RepID=UPI00404A3962